MARRGYHQREHKRNRDGKSFVAGRAKVNTNLHLIPGQFSFMGTAPWYGGYSDDRSKWNGFDCPYFTKDVAIQILKKLANAPKSQGEFRYAYVPGRDAFKITGDYDDNVLFEGDTFQTVDGPKRLYCIGGWMWTWEKKRGG